MSNNDNNNSKMSSSRRSSGNIFGRNANVGIGGRGGGGDNGSTTTVAARRTSGATSAAPTSNTTSSTTTGRTDYRAPDQGWGGPLTQLRSFVADRPPHHLFLVYSSPPRQFNTLPYHIYSNSYEQEELTGNTTYATSNNNNDDDDEGMANNLTPEEERMRAILDILDEVDRILQLEDYHI